MSTEGPDPSGAVCFPEGRFCWNHDLAVPGESIWSLLQKFAVWNFINPCDVRRLMRDPGLSSREIRTSRGGGHFGNLKSASGFELRNLSLMLAGSSDDVVSRAFLSNLRDEETPKGALRTERLRFCPECFRLGLHFTVFQDAHLRRCPAHDVALISDCPDCSKGIDFLLSSSDHESAYRCAMGCTFWDRVSSPDRAVEVKRVGAIVEPSESLVRVLNKDPNILICRPKDEDGATVPALAAIMTGFPPLAGYDQPKEIQYWLVPADDHRPTENEPSNTFWDDIASTYRSFRRNLLRSLHKRERMVRAHEVTLRTYEGPGEEVPVPPSCDTLALAYVLWRLFWERIRFIGITEKLASLAEAIDDRISHLFIVPSADPQGIEDRECIGINRAIYHRFLLNALEGSFLECAAIVEAAQAGGSQSVHLSSITGRYVRSLLGRSRADGAVELVSVADPILPGVESLLLRAKGPVPQRRDARSVVKWLRKAQIDRLRGPVHPRDLDSDEWRENDQRADAAHR